MRPTAPTLETAQPKNWGDSTRFVNRAFIAFNASSVKPVHSKAKAMTGLLGDIEKFLVWEKGAEVPGLDRRLWRTDDFGNLIHFPHYGDRSSQYGWEKDHKVPSILGGSDTLNNLRPLHHTANARLGAPLSRLGDLFK